MRSTKRSPELPPLSVDGAVGRKPQGASVGPRSLPKVYPRLQTLTQLTDKYVRGLRTGDFVLRSEKRWQDFDGVDAPNSARYRTINTVNHSAALVIQCSWRKHVALTTRGYLEVMVWQRQLDIAAKITRQSAPLTHALQVMTTSERNRLQAVASIIPICGFYFHAPAKLMSWWLGFTCAHLFARRILRHPPIVIRAVDVPVKFTRSKLVTMWRCMIPLAALILQCCIRTFFARRIVAKRKLARLQHQAALRLQGFIRVYNAQHIARRFRRWYAVIRIQCFWRCHRARQYVQQRRMTWVATCVCTPLILQGAKQATAKLRVQCARTIQKHYRGCRSRAYFRGLLSRHEQQKWRQNPSKGYDFFDRRRYDQAALHFENCFRQGIFADEPIPIAQHSSTEQCAATVTPHRNLVSGSRMSFSFSAAPTKLGTDWILQRDDFHNVDGLKGGVARLAARLQFWQAYAISHFRVYEATGDTLNLNQARVGWQSYLQLDGEVKFWPHFQDIAASLTELRYRSQFQLAQCLFLGGKHSDKDQALSLSLSVLQHVKKVVDVGAIELEAQLMMLSSMLYFEQNCYSSCCAQLEKLLDLPSPDVFLDVEVRFTLALILLKRYEESFETSTGAYRIDEAEASTFLRTASQLLKQCYRVVELWPSVGFYHGFMKKSDAKRLLTTEPVGSFLLHHSLDALNADDISQRHTISQPTGKILLMQVKLSDRPLRIASSRIEFTDNELYKTRKMPAHLGHFSLHGLIANLPPEAGVRMERGIRKSLYSASLKKKLERSQPEVLREKVSIRSLLLDWGEWERKLNEIALSETRWKRRNETWSAVCFEIAKLLECSQAWVFASVAAQEALVHSKTSSHRANINFLAARVNICIQKRNEGALLMQQARLETPRTCSTHSTKLFLGNLTAVQRALSLNVSLSRQEPFICRLGRVQKLERMCSKAWECDSLAPRLSGSPFEEALLLQRISDEMFADCGDTFFVRSLLKAHVRAYVANDSWCGGAHLKCAYACVLRLFDRFHKHQETWTTHLVSLTHQIRGQSRSRAVKTRAFNVKLLLLSWHHMPFLVCFEIAEVLYRYKTHSSSTLIDVYESLQGRLRGSRLQTPVYAMYEELILLRVAFLHAAKVSQAENSWRHLGAAVSAISEILNQRSDRAKMYTSESVKRQAKRIKWPNSLRFPFYFTDAQLRFVRGLFAQMQEDLMRIPAERRSSWRDFHPLHQDLMALVMKSAPPGEVAGSGGRMLNSVRYRAENLRGVRVFVGATHDVVISNMLLSQPCVVIQYEGKTTPTRTAPTWTNLSPSWEEDMEIPVSSVRTTITISVKNRTRRNSRWQDATTIGYVSISMQNLLAAPDGITPGKFYELTLSKPPTQRPGSGNAEHRSRVARIFLSFQVIVNTQQMPPSSAERTASWATRSGNWNVEDVRAHLHGDLQIFVSSRWVWSRFASLFMQDNDVFIAKWFFVKSVRLTSELQRRTSKIGVQLNSTDSLAIVNDLIGLSKCYRANLGDLRWAEQAAPLLGQAEAILTRKTSQNKRGYCSTSDCAAREKQLTFVREFLADALGTQKRIGPLQEALSRKSPATSEWVKITSRESNGSISVRYVNQDTGETFQSKWRVEPLEYEDKEAVMTEEQERLPHRIIVMTSEMKARVSFHRQELLRLHAADPFQWIAVLNDRKKELQFFSPHSPQAYSSPGGSTYPARPPTYIMLADEFLLYHVLLVQDAYRKFRSKRQRQRRLRGVLLSAALASRELVAARQRLLLRSLNCVCVVVEKAEHLRASDLLTSDPFVVLTLRDSAGAVVASGETSVRYNSLNPKWNEEFHFRYSFTGHDVQQSANSSLKEMREAVLIFEVFDYDVVSTRMLGDESAVETTQQKAPGDFLGVVTIPLKKFLHGKQMTADLPLLDEKGENNSPRTRGLLTVSVQWNHCAEEDTKVEKLWAIGSGGGRALIARKAAGPLKVPEEAAREIGVLRQQMEQLLQLMLSMGVDVLEPMHRLRSRMQTAQSKGKTAEEAKMLEKRLDAMLRTQLLPKLKVVRGLVVERIDNQLPVILKKLFGPIEEYLSGVDLSSRRELRSLMEKCLDELSSTMHFLKTAPPLDITPVDAMNAALAQQQQLYIWNDQLRQILETFFIGESAQWHFLLKERVDEVYRKLGDGSRDRRGPEQEKAAARPASAAAVAKRKERIERAKEEKAWYEL